MWEMIHDLGNNHFQLYMFRVSNRKDIMDIFIKKQKIILLKMWSKIKWQWYLKYIIHFLLVPFSTDIKQSFSFHSVQVNIMHRGPWLIRWVSAFQHCRLRFEETVPGMVVATALIQHIKTMTKTTHEAQAPVQHWNLAAFQSTMVSLS